MMRAKDLLLLHPQLPANTEKATKRKTKTEEYETSKHLQPAFPLDLSPYFSPCYLRELPAAAEFLTEGVELCRDLLVGPSQLSG